MKAGGGKQKGSSFERQICKQLSLWISNGERDNLFWRSAMSGGRATVRAKKGERTDNQLGDITAIDPMGHILTDKFIIECKCYKDLQWTSFVYGKGFIWNTWNLLLDICLHNNKTPFLILKQNAYPTVVATTVDCGILPMLTSSATVYFYDLKDLINRVSIEEIVGVA